MHFMYFSLETMPGSYGLWWGVAGLRRVFSLFKEQKWPIDFLFFGVNIALTLLCYYFTFPLLRTRGVIWSTGFWKR